MMHNGLLMHFSPGLHLNENLLLNDVKQAHLNENISLNKAYHRGTEYHPGVCVSKLLLSKVSE